MSSSRRTPEKPLVIISKYFGPTSGARIAIYQANHEALSNHFSKVFFVTITTRGNLPSVENVLSNCVVSLKGFSASQAATRVLSD